MGLQVRMLEKNKILGILRFRDDIAGAQIKKLCSDKYD